MKPEILLSSLLPCSGAIALSVKVPSPQSFFDDPCATLRLPPRVVNATFLDQVDVEQVWIEPPFAFGYGKWALAWTSIEEYWGWSNMQVMDIRGLFPTTFESDR